MTALLFQGNKDTVLMFAAGCGAGAACGIEEQQFNCANAGGKQRHSLHRCVVPVASAAKIG